MNTYKSFQKNPSKYHLYVFAVYNLNPLNVFITQGPREDQHTTKIKARH